MSDTRDFLIACVQDSAHNLQRLFQEQPCNEVFIQREAQYQDYMFKCLLAVEAKEKIYPVEVRDE